MDTDLGLWWAPYAPDMRLPGTLRIDEDGTAKLVVLGDISGGGRPPTSILGATREHGHVTLTRIADAGFSMRFEPAVRQQEITAWTAVLGAHAPDTGLPVINYFAEIHGLRDWVFSGSRLRTVHETDDRVTILRENPPAPCSPAAVGPLNITIKTGELFPYGSAQDLTISERVGLTLESTDNAFSIEAGNSALRSVQNLITLLRDAPVGIGAVMVQSPVAEHQMSNGQRQLLPVHLKQVGEFYNPSHAADHQHFPLIAYAECAARWPALVTTWLELEARVGPALDSFFSTVYLGDMLPQQAFLSVMQAIEAYHRVVIGGSYMPASAYLEEVWPQLSNCIPTALERSHRDALRGRIKYGYEYSLRKRLSQVIEKLPAHNERLFRNGQLIAAAVATRNYFVHLDPTLRDEAWLPHEVSHLSYEIGVLLKGCLLLDLGFSEDVVATIVDDHILAPMHRDFMYRRRRNTPAV